MKRKPRHRRPTPPAPRNVLTIPSWFDGPSFPGGAPSKKDVEEAIVAGVAALTRANLAGRRAWLLAFAIAASSLPAAQSNAGTGQGTARAAATLARDTDVAESPAAPFMPLFRPAPPVRRLSPAQAQGLGPMLADIESHMPAGHVYANAADHCNWAHETVHGINSRLREQTGKPVREVFYVGGDRVFVCRRPRITIQHVAQLVPAPFRAAPTWDYIAKPPRWSDDSVVNPLYLFDEWTAYTAGSDVSLDPFSVQQMLTFNGYALAVLESIELSDPSYPAEQLAEFIGWNCERTFEVADRAAAAGRGRQSHGALINQLLAESTHETAFRGGRCRILRGILDRMRQRRLDRLRRREQRIEDRDKRAHGPWRGVGPGGPNGQPSQPGQASTFADGSGSPPILVAPPEAASPANPRYIPDPAAQAAADAANTRANDYASKLRAAEAAIADSQAHEDQLAQEVDRLRRAAAQEPAGSTAAPGVFARIGASLLPHLPLAGAIAGGTGAGGLALWGAAWAARSLAGRRAARVGRRAAPPSRAAQSPAQLTHDIKFVGVPEQNPELTNLLHALEVLGGQSPLGRKFANDVQSYKDQLTNRATPST